MLNRIKVFQPVDSLLVEKRVYKSQTVGTVELVVPKANKFTVSSCNVETDQKKKTSTFECSYAFGFM